MPFARDPRQTIIDRIAGDLESRLPGFDAQLPLSVTNVLAIAHGIQMDGEYGYLAKMALNIFPWSVFGEYADRTAAWNNIQRKPPLPATGAVTATGTNGAPIAAALIAQRSDGEQFIVNAGATIEGGSATLAVTAMAAGTAGNTNAGGTLTLLEPPDGVSATLTVAAPGLVGGAAQETTAAMMARVEAYQQERPQGGAPSDYVEFGAAQPGVTRAWCLPQWTGIGKTGLAVVNDNATPIFLTDTQLAAIQTALNAWVPVPGKGIVITPTAWNLNPTISLDPNTAEVQGAVAVALSDFVASNGAVSGAVDPATMDVLDGGFYLTAFNEAIKSAPGLDDYAVTLLAGVAPGRRVAPGINGQLMQLGNITWTD